MCSEEASNLAGGTCVYRDLSCNDSNAQIAGEEEILSGTSMCLEGTSNLAGGTCVTDISTTIIATLRLRRRRDIEWYQCPYWESRITEVVDETI